jgi:hypothetical protein
MNTLKRGFILLVAVLFLVVSIGGAQAGTTKGSKSNADNMVSSPSAGDTGDSSPSDRTSVKSSKSNTSDRGQDPKTESINLNSPRSN